MSKQVIGIFKISLLYLITVGASASPHVAKARESNCAPDGAPGRWSKEATDMISSKDGRCADESNRNLRVYSPDKKNIIHVVSDRWWIERDGRRVNPALEHSKVGYPAEIGWSSDSKAFYLTQGSGNFGPFSTEVFTVSNSGVAKAKDVNRLVQKAFDPTYGCILSDGKPRMYPSNVAGFKWMDGAAALLVIAEVPPNNLCAHASYFKGYVIDMAAPTPKIEESYNPQQLQARWGREFGIALRGDYETLSERQLK